jgi:hypothetical protein
MPHRANGSYVSNADALTAWTPIARDELLETARTYRATVSYQDLATLVQERSGIRTDQLVSHWIGKLLERVVVDVHRRGEPPLTSLCVHQDGSIGDGYSGTPRAEADTREISPVDLERLAAEHRLLCYREYATDLPADGGELEVHRPAPRVTSRSRSTATARPKVAAPPTLREVTCHECFLIVTAGPVCSSCGAPLPAYVG